MDFNQRKLSKTEWDSIEIPVSQDECNILNMIVAGYHDVNVKHNQTQSLFTYLKIDPNPALESHLFSTYFAETIKKLNIQINLESTTTIKKADQIRLNSTSTTTSDQLLAKGVFEFVLMFHAERACLAETPLKDKKKKSTQQTQSVTTPLEFHYFTLSKLIKNVIPKTNRHVLEVVHEVLRRQSEPSPLTVIQNAHQFIEKNHELLKYGDIELYKHQKEIFTTIRERGSDKNVQPKLILYIAPTGTGKTMTPLGISEENRIIFVCAARHVGLALAKSAVSINKKVAFAFGCEGANDIRLHYFAAKVFEKDRRSGKIRKVDNSIGELVEIMICDIKSYEIAMHYMLAQPNSKPLVMYWDEPTITLDYPDHEFHKIIAHNWRENLIPTIVLSSATLPKLHEIPDVVSDFQTKFNGTIHEIISHDCRKTIPIIDPFGYVVMPHTQTNNYAAMQEIVAHCEEHLTLLRYFDLREICKFIVAAEKLSFADAPKAHSKTTFLCAGMPAPQKLTPIGGDTLARTRKCAKIDRTFTSIDDIDLQSIKMHYLRLLRTLNEQDFNYLFVEMQRLREPRLNSTQNSAQNELTKMKSVDNVMTVSGHSGGYTGKPISKIASESAATTITPQKLQVGLYVTTCDAYTLTHGPTFFMANDVTKIAKFCLQQAAIPPSIMQDIREKISHNSVITERIFALEQQIEDANEEAKESVETIFLPNGQSKTVTKRATTKKTSGNGTNEDRKNREEQKEDLIDSTKLSQLKEQLESLHKLVKNIALNDIFVPNKKAHLEKWCPTLNPASGAPFACDIESATVTKIMRLHEVEEHWKVLLLMGIGAFTHAHATRPDYLEIMKQLAEQQKLFMIIADSDYIYGTNYQSCHGYISKDLTENLTQEKLIQAMGRIGRNNIQQEYSIRLRDVEQMRILFKTYLPEEKPEVVNMNRLFGGCNLQENCN